MGVRKTRVKRYGRLRTFLLSVAILLTLQTRAQSDAPRCFALGGGNYIQIPSGVRVRESGYMEVSRFTILRGRAAVLGILLYPGGNLGDFFGDDIKGMPIRKFILNGYPAWLARKGKMTYIYVQVGGAPQMHARLAYDSLDVRAARIAMSFGVDCRT